MNDRASFAGRFAFRSHVFGLLFGFALVPSVLVAAPPQTFTDSDGDDYSVKVSGPGSAAVTLDDPDGNSEGPIASIVLTGTDATSILTISVVKVGDGRVGVGAITGANKLGMIVATKCDFTGSGIQLGGLSSLRIGDVASGANLVLPGAPKAKPLAFTARDVGAMQLTAPSSTLTFTARSVTGGAQISAAQIAAFNVTGGHCAADISTPGKLVSLSVKGGDFTGHIVAGKIGTMSVAKNKAGIGGAMVNSTITARKIGTLLLDRDLSNSLILAGATLGADGALGGTGADADAFAAGSIGTVRIKGSMTNSILGAGFSPVNGAFGDINDGVIGNGRMSVITAFTVKGTLDATSFVGARKFPQKVSVGGRRFAPLTSPRFISRRAGPPIGPVAPPFDPTVAQPAALTTSFLYTGTDPVQTGVAAGTIVPVRAAVLRGRVLTRAGVPLAGVMVTVLDHPEFGRTHSGAGGIFDMGVNGGGLLTVKFDAAGFSSAQRQVNADMQDFAVLPDVMLVEADPMVTAVNFGADAPMQIHEATMQSDASGDRHAMLMFSPGTSAALTMADGTTQPMNLLNVRATEFTVGPDGPKAMPGTLPATSAYTYCVDLTADEVEDAGATGVTFDKPVWLYVENFLHFEAGIAVPSGFFDREKGQWVAGPSGRVVKVISITSGAVDLDVTGDGNVDTGATLAALSITDPERTQLAAKYAAGQSLWRVPIPHFSPWDSNWSFGPPADAQPPKQPKPKTDKKPDAPTCCGGSIVEIQGQVLGEMVALTGTPFTLNYASDRAPGRKAANQVRIALSDATLPASLKRIDLEINVAGRTFLQDFPATTHQSTAFEWDGLDAYGRQAQGRQSAKIRIGYVYDGSYVQTEIFGYNGNGVPITGDATRKEVTLSTNYTTAIGALDIRRQSIGGWTLNVHHIYDPTGRVLYQGDGTRRSVESVNSIMTTFAGTGVGGFSGSEGPATQAQIRNPWGIGVMSNGSVLICETSNHRIRRVDTAGIIHEFAGTGVPGFSGDGGPAKDAQISFPTRANLAPDGSIYIDDNGNRRVRRILPDGTIVTAAGNGQAGNGGDNGPATAAQIGGDPDPFPAADGTVYFSDIGNNRIRRIGTDGIISAFAGTGSVGFSGDGGPALQATFGDPIDLVPTRDGYLFVLDARNNRIRRIGPEGNITTVAGGGGDSTTEGIEALQADLNFASGGELAPSPDGGIYFSERQRQRIRHLRADGTIVTVAGNGSYGTSGDGGPALQAQIQNPFGLAVGPDGSIYIGDTDAHRVRRVAPPLPGFTATDFAIPSEDGSQLYRFDSAGRHLSTVNTFTGATLFIFAYDAGGRLVKITDASSNVTTIQRTAAGAPTAFVAPFGQRTILTTDANGSLATVQDPRGGTYSYTTSADGLLTGETDPEGHVHVFTYDSAGRLIKDDSPGAPFGEFARVDLPNGYIVTETDALGLAGSYKTEELANGDELRTNTDALGLVTTELRRTSGVDVSTTPDGMVQTTTTTGDPRFSFMAPVESKTTIATPGAMLLTLETTRTVVLSDPSDALSLTSLTETSKINGRTSTTTFTAATKTFDSATPVGRHSVSTINDRGQPRSVRIGDLAATVFDYDARGRVTSATAGQGSAVRLGKLSYNAQGFVATATDPLNRLTNFFYDLGSNPTDIVLPGQRTITLTYDADNQIKQIKEPLGALHEFDYTEFDTLASYTAPDVGTGPATTSFDYNPRKQLSKITRPGSQTIGFAYDAASRLTTRTVATGATTFAYHPTSGLLTTITAPDASTLSFTYDGAIPLGSTWTGTVTGSVTRTIGNDLRTESQSVNGADTVSFTYDNDGLLTAAGPLTLSHAAATGLLTGLTIDGIGETLGHNEFGEVTSVTVKNGASDLFAQQFRYDKLGRITQKSETISGTTTVFDYSYDTADRLSTVTKNGILSESYSYDKNGNRTTANGVSATYDAQNRLTQLGSITYSYTAAGDLMSKTASGQATQYTYDGLGNLTTVALPDGTAVTYVTDGLNRRIGRNVNASLVQGFLYQDNLEIAAELDGNNNIVSRFVYARGRNVPDYMVKGGVSYRLLSDTNASVRVVVDSNTGVIVQQLDYDAFGQVTQDSNPGFQPFGFAGGLHDQLTKLDRFGARDYDAEAGRWTAKDPLLFAGGATNFYEYVANDPINRNDPSGTGSVKVGPLNLDIPLPVTVDPTNTKTPIVIDIPELIQPNGIPYSEIIKLSIQFNELRAQRDLLRTLLGWLPGQKCFLRDEIRKQIERLNAQLLSIANQITALVNKGRANGAGEFNSGPFRPRGVR